MTKKFRIIIFIVACFIIGIVLYNNCDFAYMGSIHKKVASIDSSGSSSSFLAKKGDKIKFYCNSLIKEGKLRLYLSDSNGKVIHNFETNKKYSEEVVIENDDEYEVYANYTDFSGDFNVRYR